jgi:hypothetical protein
MFLTLASTPVPLDVFESHRGDPGRRFYAASAMGLMWHFKLPRGLLVR